MLLAALLAELFISLRSPLMTEMRTGQTPIAPLQNVARWDDWDTPAIGESGSDSWGSSYQNTHGWGSDMGFVRDNNPLSNSVNEQSSSLSFGEAGMGNEDAQYENAGSSAMGGGLHDTSHGQESGFTPDSGQHYGMSRREGMHEWKAGSDGEDRRTGGIAASLPGGDRRGGSFAEEGARPGVPRRTTGDDWMDKTSEQHGQPMTQFSTENQEVHAKSVAADESGNGKNTEDESSLSKRVDEPESSNGAPINTAPSQLSHKIGKGGGNVTEGEHSNGEVLTLDNSTEQHPKRTENVEIGKYRTTKSTGQSVTSWTTETPDKKRSVWELGSLQDNNKAAGSTDLAGKKMSGFHSSGAGKRAGGGSKVQFARSGGRPETCPCFTGRKASGGKCYYYTNEGEGACAERKCSPKYHCTTKGRSTRTCMLRKLESRVVRTADGSCETVSVRGTMYVPYM